MLAKKLENPRFNLGGFDSDLLDVEAGGVPADLGVDPVHPDPGHHRQGLRLHAHVHQLLHHYLSQQRHRSPRGRISRGVNGRRQSVQHFSLYHTLRALDLFRGAVQGLQ